LSFVAISSFSVRQWLIGCLFGAELLLELDELLDRDELLLEEELDELLAGRAELLGLGAGTAWGGQGAG
jgi:hypothetical protein